MRTRLFKLVTGEEIIAQSEGLQEFPTGARFSVKRVRVISRMPVQTPAGIQFVNVLAPYWGGSPSDNLLLRTEHIVQEVDPEPELERTYMAESTGIALASSVPRGRG